MRVAVVQRRLDYVSFSLSHIASGERDRFNPLSAAGMPRLSDVNAGSCCVLLTSDASEKKSVRNNIERRTLFV